MNPPIPFSEKIEKCRQTFWQEIDEDHSPAAQELFQALSKFRESHPIDIMSEYNRARKGSD